MHTFLLAAVVPSLFGEFNLPLLGGVASIRYSSSIGWPKAIGTVSRVSGGGHATHFLRSVAAVLKCNLLAT